MSKDRVKANVLRIDDHSRELLKLMHFPDIPEEATHVAFFEDGNAQFMAEFSVKGLILPEIYMLSVYKDIEVEIEE